MPVEKKTSLPKKGVKPKPKEKEKDPFKEKEDKKVKGRTSPGVATLSPKTPTVPAQNTLKKKPSFKEVRDACVVYDTSLQEGQVNARATLVAGYEGKYAWVCEREGTLTIRSIRTGSVLATISRMHIFPWSLAEGFLKRDVWVGYSDGRIILFNSAPPYNEVKVLESGPRTGGCYCLLSHLSFVFAGYGNCQIIKWNAQTQKREGYYVGHTGGYGSAVRSLALHLSTLFSSGDDMTVRAWDVTTCNQLMAFKGHEASVLSLAYTRRNHLWSSGEDGLVKVWEPESGKCLKTHQLPSPAGVLKYMGNRVWCGCWDKSAVLYNHATLEKVSAMKKHKGALTDVAYVAATRIFKVWTCGTDKTIRTWTMECNDDEFEAQLKDDEREMFNLKSENDMLNKELGKGRRVRATSCWDIDTVAYCSTEVARNMRTEMQTVTRDNDTLKAKAEVRQQFIIDMWLKQGTNVEQALMAKYYWKLYKGWAKTAAANKYSFKHFDRLQKSISGALVKNYFDQLQKFAILRKQQAVLRTSFTLVLSVTDYGVMQLTYHKLLAYKAERQRQAMRFTIFNLLASLTPSGMRRIYYFKLYRHYLRIRHSKAKQSTYLLMKRCTEIGTTDLYYKKWAKWASQVHSRRVVSHALAQVSSQVLMKIVWDRLMEHRNVKRKEKRMIVIGNTLRKNLTITVIRQAWSRLVLNAWQKRQQTTVQARISLALRNTHLFLIQKYYGKLQKNIKASMATRLKTKAASSLRGINMRCLLMKYYVRLLKRRVRRKDRAAMSRTLSKQMAWGLLRRYYYKLMVKRRVTLGNKADQKSSVLEAKNKAGAEENRQLVYKVTELGNAAIQARATVDETLVSARVWEKRYMEYREANASLVTTLDKVQKEASLVKDKLKQSKSALHSRPQILQAATEVFKRILAADKLVQDYADVVSRKQLPRVLHLQHTTKIHSSLKGIKKQQAACIERYFASPEKLTSNISSVFYGRHANDPYLIPLDSKRDKKSNPRSLSSATSSPPRATISLSNI